MQLIDGDALKKDDELNLWLSNDTVRTGKTVKTFSELFVKKINSQPTIQAVPVAVLDKIKSEIEEHVLINQAVNVDRANALCWCLDVIDKYTTEIEDNE